VCIRYRGNVSTEPFPSKDKGIHIQTQTDGRDFLIRPTYIQYIYVGLIVPGSILGASRFSERQWVWNGVHSAS
jgi:hypothetical protein